MSNESQKIQNDAALLPLDVPRVVKLKANDRVYTWRFRRLTADDWHKYFTGVVHQTLHVAGAREAVFESETAQLDLVDRTVSAVEGYGDLSGVKNWKAALPIYHRFAVGTALRSVGVAAPDEEEAPLCDLAEVRLDAVWSAGDDDKMTEYKGLVHRFRQPGLAELKRFNFECARTRVTGDAENGATIHPSRMAIAMKLYDDLIDSVEGYSVAGVPLADADAIKREMDGAHKAEAALALFAPGGKVQVL